MVFPSNIFWENIASANYYTYKYRLGHCDKKDWEEDLKTQIYINSLICYQKTSSYNYGINCLISSFFSFVLHHVWLCFLFEKEIFLFFH